MLVLDYYLVFINILGFISIVAGLSSILGFSSIVFGFSSILGASSIAYRDSAVVSNTHTLCREQFAPTWVAIV